MVYTYPNGEATATRRAFLSCQHNKMKCIREFRQASHSFVQGASAICICTLVRVDCTILKLRLKDCDLNACHLLLPRHYLVPYEFVCNSWLSPQPDTSICSISVTNHPFKHMTTSASQAMLGCKEMLAVLSASGNTTECSWAASP